MDPIIKLTQQLDIFSQQLRMRKLANKHQRRVTTQVRSQVWSQVWQLYASMDYAQYGGTPYLSNHTLGWSHHPNTSWNTSYTTLHTPQVQRSSLEEKMVQLERVHAKLVMERAEFSRSMAEINYSQVGLPRFLDQNEKSQPPHKRMTKLEATMAELERVCAEKESPRVPFMREVNTPPQEESIDEREVDELAITRAKLTFSRAEFLMEETKFNAQTQPIPLKSFEEEMTPMVTSCTQLPFEKEQHKQEESMSIQELVAKYMKEQENVAMSFEGQHESLPSNLEVSKYEEKLSYNEEIAKR